MPIYEYRCEACGHLHDALQKVSDERLTICPECEKPALKRLISAPSFRLKGSGWYETDFKSDKERRRNLAEHGGDKSAATAEGKGESKSDSKGADAPAASKDAGSSAKSEKKGKDKDSGSAKPAGAKSTGSEAA